jgi:His-Xaa-Ser system protein HxsD
MNFVAGVMETSVALRSYRLIAVKKAAYRLARSCTVVLGDPEGETLPISFHFRDAIDESTARATVRRFFEELLDQELREQIGEETAPLRTLIMASAFSRIDLLRRDE